MFDNERSHIRLCMAGGIQCSNPNCYSSVNLSMGDAYSMRDCQFIKWKAWSSGADSGFQVRGEHLKKLRRAERGANIFGVFRVKNHDFTPKNHIFSNFKGGGVGGGRVPPLNPPLVLPIVDNMLGVDHALCTLNTSFVHFEKKQ